MVQLQITPNKNCMLPLSLDLCVTPAAALIGQLSVDMTPHWSKQLEPALCCESGPVIAYSWASGAMQLHSNITWPETQQWAM